METIKNTSVLIVLAAIFYGAYQVATTKSSGWTDKPASVSENLAGGSTGDRSGDGLVDQRDRHQGDPHQGAAPQLSSQTPLKSIATNAPIPALSQQFATPGAGQSQNPVRHPSASVSSSPGFPGGLASTIPNVSTGQLQVPTATNGVGLPGGSQQRHRSAQANLTAPMTEVPGRSQAVDQVGFNPSTNSGFPNSTVSTLGNGDLRPIRGTPPVVATNAALLSQLRTTMQSAGSDIAAGQHGRALAKLTQWSDQPLAAADRKQLFSWLDKLAMDVVYSGQHHLAQPYTILTGDTLRSISMRHQVTPELLANINGLQIPFDQALPQGQQLKVLPGPFRAHADIAKGELTVFLGDLYAGRFAFQVGDSGPIESKTHAVSHVSLAGLPAQAIGGQGRHEPMTAGNPYGRYCIVLGTEVFHSLGKQTSSGCMVFSEKDMLDLIALLGKDCQVSIRR